jgi:uncharacterized protein DUF6328
MNYERDESESATLDRNYAELLQELRVGETGVQILFAFLLGIAFQQRFTELTDTQLDIYIATLVTAALAAVLFIAPVPIHRILFRQRVKDELVRITARLAMAALAFLIAAILGAVLLIVDVVANTTAAIAVTVALGVVCAIIWYVLPLRWRRMAVTDGKKDS